jgi:hypothetical protein
MRGAIPPLLQYVFMAWCLVKHRDSFTLPLTVRQRIAIWTDEEVAEFILTLFHIGYIGTK